MRFVLCDHSVDSFQQKREGFSESVLKSFGQTLELGTSCTIWGRLCPATVCICARVSGTFAAQSHSIIAAEQDHSLAETEATTYRLIKVFDRTAHQATA